MGSKNMAAYMAKRRAGRRGDLLELLGGKCKSCGAGEDLQFDHVVPGTRVFALSGCHLDKAWELILIEAGKCQVLCRTCHHRKSVEHGEMGGGQNKITDPLHGTPYMYTMHNCRCVPCKYAKSLYRKKMIRFSQQVDPV